MVIQNSGNMIKPLGSIRGAYSNLNLYFQEAVNCYYKHTSEISPKDSTVSTRANAGARFLLFLQKKALKVLLILQNQTLLITYDKAGTACLMEEATDFHYVAF